MIVQPGNGYGFYASGYGASLDLSKPFPEDASAFNNYKPLFPTIDATDKVTVSPGTVNRIVPKIGSAYIDAATAPTVTVTGEGYICIKLTYVAATFFPRTAEIIFNAGTATPADTETIGYYPLAKVNSVTVGSVTTYSLIVFSYGNFICNRLKSGANPAAWYWATITPQPGT
jgi:hypothetical protein